MSDTLTLRELDPNGAIEEAAYAADGDPGGTRSDFFRKAAIGGGSLVAGGVVFGGLPALALGAPSKSQDVDILNYALTLEYLETAFYAQARTWAGLRGDVARFAAVAGAHEAAHVKALKKVLGSKAVAKPKFDFGATVRSQKAFVKTAIAVEDLGVSAYAGQGPRLKQVPVIQAALAIHSIEARHAAWIRFIAGMNPAPVAFDPARDMKQVLAVAGGFIAE
ncbi:ferritin-like domain-containing protein [Miltoncostaea oceani]|uniref:ferritin-like domain-containing protein n=1 Tax=Miltoncostaea oceani TaxID=2843216 RepID=UPI001C3C7331|nr:ferritin-like domain-containing protein [Miltoncostaea oceani]